MRKNKVSGFTLIELLVVITIIGILAVGGVSVYTQQMAKARDTNRIKDVKSLQTAIESSFSDQNEYVRSTSFSGTIMPYMGVNGIPKDPLSTVATPSPDSCIGKNATPANSDLCAYGYRPLNLVTAKYGAYWLSTTFEVANASTAKPNTFTINTNRMELIGGDIGVLTGPAMWPNANSAKVRTATVLCKSATTNVAINLNECQ